MTVEPQKFPGLIQIRAHEGAFTLLTDRSAVHYQNFEDLTRDVLPRIRCEFQLDKPDAIKGSC